MHNPDHFIGFTLAGYWPKWNPTKKVRGLWLYHLDHIDESQAEEAARRCMEQSNTVTQPVLKEFLGHVNSIREDEKKNLAPQKKEPAGPAFTTCKMLITGCSDMDGNLPKRIGIWPGRIHEFAIPHRPECAPGNDVIKSYCDKMAQRLRESTGCVMEFIYDFGDRYNNEFAQHSRRLLLMYPAPDWKKTPPPLPQPDGRIDAAPSVYPDPQIDISQPIETAPEEYGFNENEIPF